MLDKIFSDDWKIIEDFPNYAINRFGDIWNLVRDAPMQTSLTNHGHTKISLVRDGQRYDRSVAVLVAQAFVPVPNPKCDSVIILNGILSDVRAENLMWRPRSFAWQYSRQLRIYQPVYYYNLEVEDVVYNVIYENIETAGKTLGILFDDIWRSTYRGTQVYPTNSIFKVLHRV